MSVAMGLYFFAISWVLAQLEIQIEGAHGWAERLPTWRWQSDAVLRWAGKPITGYHVFLQAFLLLFIHLPLMYTGFSVDRESELLALFFLMTVFWDFLWFVCNPHYGIARFRRGQVWWFKSWFLGLPVPYYMGVAASALLYMAVGLLQHPTALPERLLRWSLVFGAFLVPTLLTLAAALIGSRRKSPLPDAPRA